MALLIDLAVYSIVCSFIASGIAARFFGRSYAWLGTVVGVLCGIYIIYPTFWLLPVTFWTQLEYSINNLNQTDLTDPVNATALLFGTMFVYLAVAGLAAVNKIAKMRY